jgi:hypothetical protein
MAHGGLPRCVRAHRLAPEGWSQLVDIAGRVPLRLWLVGYQEGPTGAHPRSHRG